MQRAGDFLSGDDWCCYAAINGLPTYLLSDGPIEFSPICHLMATPEWVKHLEFEPKSEENLILKLQNSDVVLCFRYSANALGDPHTVDGVTTTRQNYAADLVLLFNLAAWLAGPFDVLSSGFFHFRVDEDYRVFRSAGDGPNVRLVGDNIPIVGNADQIRAIAETWRKITAVRRNCSVWIAIWMLHKALCEQFWFVRLLMIWVALEALFGPLERQQLTYQLCERISLFIKGPNAEGEQLFVDLKKSYGMRSKVVHGGGLGGVSEQGMIELEFIEGVARASLTRILASGGLIEIFSTKKREKFLQQLTFGGVPN
jgi:hypothetical protein